MATKSLEELRIETLEQQVEQLGLYMQHTVSTSQMTRLSALRQKEFEELTNRVEVLENIIKNLLSVP